MKNKKNNNLAANTQNNVKLKREIIFEIPDIGVGRMAPTTTHILMCLLFEETKHEKLAVLHSVFEHLGMEPNDLIIYAKNGKKHEKSDYDNDEPYSWEK